MIQLKQQHNSRKIMTKNLAQPFIASAWLKGKLCNNNNKLLWRYYAKIVIVLLLLALLLFTAMQGKFSSSNIITSEYLKRVLLNSAETNTTQSSEVVLNWPQESIASSAPSDCKCSNTFQKNYLTSALGATCAGGLSNRLFELISLYGIARSINRTAYVSMFSDCILNRMREFTSIFPNLAEAFEMRLIHNNLTKFVPFAQKCCTYDNVTKLLAYNSSQYISLDTIYLQSFKFFHQYKPDVLRLLQFTNEDIRVAEDIANNASFLSSNDYKLCVHIRRGDFLTSSIHQWSTESFTKGAVYYLRDKLHKAGKNVIVAVLGDDRAWAEKLFENDSWVHVPNQIKRPSADYAFFARHCQTVLITASASTFAWWSAYLSSAENIYFNKDYALGAALKNDLTPADFYPPSWICLAQNKITMEITEEQRN